MWAFSRSVLNFETFNLSDKQLHELGKMQRVSSATAHINIDLK
jgi:hypothetical protein